MSFSAPVHRNPLRVPRLFLTLAACMPALAQTSGGLRLEVRDAKGQPAAGVDLVLESLQRGEQRHLRTDARGQAAVSGLLPGRYRVREHELQIRPDEVAFLRFQLRLAEAVVAVEGTMLQGETSSVSVQTRLDAEILAALPSSPHRYTEQSAVAPGVTPSGKPEPVVLGSMLDANAFVVDGMPTNLGSSGRFGMNLSSEILESLTLTTGGHKAEVGFAPGGVFNMVTKSGTNEFRGSVFTSAIRRGLNGRPGAGKVNQPDERPTNANEFGFTLGGPLVKDRLFFFAGFNRQLLSLDFENVKPIGDVPHRRSQNERRSYRFAKLTWLLNADHRVEFSYFGDPVQQHNFDLAGDPSVKDFQLPDRTRGGDSFLIHHIGVLAPSLTLTSTFGVHRTDFRWTPATPEAGPSRAQLDAPGGETFGRYNEEQLQKLKNSTLRSELAWFGGGHAVKAGFQGLWSEFNLAYKRPSGGERYTDRAAGGAGPSGGTVAAIRTGLQTFNGSDYGYAAGDSLLTASPVSGQLQGGRASYLYLRALSDLNAYGNPLKQRIAGLFAQDDWAASAAWTFHLGLRADRVAADGEDGRQLYSETLVSPRLGFSFDPTEKGRARIFVYAGRIYSPPTPGALRPAGATTDGPSTVQQAWIPALSAWKTYAQAGVAAPATLAVQPGLKAPATELIQLGAERMQGLGVLGPWVLEAVLTQKKSRNLIDTYDPAWGYLQPSDLGLAAFTANVRVIGNLPGLVRTYRGADLVAHRAWEDGSRVQVSYTNGRLTGNSEVGSVASSSPTSTGFARIPSLFRDYRGAGQDGALNEDVRHAFKAFGLKKLPRGFEISGIGMVRSGLHYSVLQRVSGNDVLAPGATRGGETLPWSRSLDVTLAWTRRIRGADLRAALDIFNLTNEQPGVTVNNRLDASHPAPSITNYQQPRVFQASLRLSF